MKMSEHHQQKNIVNIKSYPKASNNLNINDQLLKCGNRKRKNKSLIL